LASLTLSKSSRKSSKRYRTKVGTSIDNLAAFVKKQFEGTDVSHATDSLNKLIAAMAITGEVRDEVLNRRIESFDSFIDQMVACANNNPYLVNAAKYIENHNLLNYILEKPPAEVKETVQMAVVYAFLLDTLTTKCTKDTPFFERMFTNLWENIQASNYQFNTFQKAKLYSVYAGLDLVIKELKNQKASNSVANMLVLPVNVMEAVTQDRHMGLYDNADAGAFLAKYNPTSTPNPKTGSGPRSLSADGKMIEMHFPLSQNWDDLYSTWNMGFCSHYPNFPFYFAKLMNPTVGCYQEKPEQYIIKRGIALYVHLVFSARTTNKNVFPFSTIDWFNVPHSQGWGAANVVSGNDYEAKVLAADPKAPSSKTVSVVNSVMRKVQGGGKKKKTLRKHFK